MHEGLVVVRPVEDANTYHGAFKRV